VSRLPFRGLPGGIACRASDYAKALSLHVIDKPMLTINFADDLTNPPQFLHMPTGIELHFGADSRWP
jgi:hypothetical protein